MHPRMAEPSLAKRTPLSPACPEKGAPQPETTKKLLSGGRVRSVPAIHRTITRRTKTDPNEPSLAFGETPATIHACHWLARRRLTSPVAPHLPPRLLTADWRKPLPVRTPPRLPWRIHYCTATCDDRVGTHTVPSSTSRTRTVHGKPHLSFPHRPSKGCEHPRLAPPSSLPPHPNGHHQGMVRLDWNIETSEPDLPLLFTA
jgi:hypothetical protein